MMTIQTLVSTMHQNNFSLLTKMNIQSDAIVVNQCDVNSEEKFKFKDHIVQWINTTERGVGKSRNRAILASSADILLFADDDVEYDENAPKLVTGYFEKNKNVSLVVFNLESLNPKRPEIVVKSDYKLSYWNCLKFGAFRIAIKRRDLLKNNMFFSLLFGGGAEFQAGEDNLFITQCLQKGMKCHASSQKIGTVAQKESTWFKGYNDKYYYDRGALFSAMYKKNANVMLCLFEAKHLNKDSFKNLKLEFAGAKRFKI